MRNYILWHLNDVQGPAESLRMTLNGESDYAAVGGHRRRLSFDSTINEKLLWILSNIYSYFINLDVLALRSSLP